MKHSSFRLASFTLASIAALLLAAGSGRGGDAPPVPASPTTQPASRPAAASAGRPNPFAPPEAPRDRLKPASTGPAAGTGPATSQPAAVAAMPVLEGVVVKGKTVLACFRAGTSTVVVEPGDVFTCGSGQVTFVSYQDEAAVVKDAGGRLCKLRISVRGGSPARAAPPTPAGYGADAW